MESVICILAHNEEKNIRRTIETILQGNRETRPAVKVYANGCTDRTHQVVADIAAKEPNVSLVILENAGKALAWNLAFIENDSEVLLFADADISPEPGAVSDLLNAFKENPSLELVCCETWPKWHAANMQQRFVGLTQIPFSQTFLAGHFYGIRKKAFSSHFARLNLTGLPPGIVAEDAFIDALVEPHKFTLSTKKVYYSPPNLDDYFCYLGRLIWQNEQLIYFKDNGIDLPKLDFRKKNMAAVYKKLTSAHGGLKRLLLGTTGTGFRLIFKLIFRRRILLEYKKLGPVTGQGSWVLSHATRSASVK